MKQLMDGEAGMECEALGAGMREREMEVHLAVEWEEAAVMER